MDVLDSAAARLKAAGIESPRLEARLLLAHVMGITQEEIIAGHGVPNIAALLRYEGVIMRRMAREPLAYILGRREFWSLDFAVGPGALIPRPDSELLVEEALKEFPKRDAALNVLDMGVGSGCLLLSFLSERPNAEGVGLDVSVPALEWAAENAAGFGFDDRVSLVQGDWATKLNTRFDAIFSNPPYIVEAEIPALEPEVGYEPHGALSGGPDGLTAYRQIAAVLPTLLTAGGRAFLELGQGQAEAVSAIFASEGIETLRIAADLAGIPRCLVLALRTAEKSN